MQFLVVNPLPTWVVHQTERVFFLKIISESSNARNRNDHDHNICDHDHFLHHQYDEYHHLHRQGGEFDAAMT